MNIAYEIERRTQELHAGAVRTFSREQIAEVERQITPPDQIPFLHVMHKVSFPPYQGKDRAFRR